MELQYDTIVKIQKLINEEIQYRSGPDLVGFFNELGFSDTYGKGFPSRWDYTQQKLNAINGSDLIIECLKKMFAPVKFVGRFIELGRFMDGLNQYLIFDGYRIVRKGKEIEIVNIDEDELSTSNIEVSGDGLEIQAIKDSLFRSLLNIERKLAIVLDHRFNEIEMSLDCKIPLATVVLCGSTLEGVLLAVANNNPAEFNSARAAPKDRTGRVLPFFKWTLGNFIDVAGEIGLLQEDVKRVSKILRDFRNYIHPYQQAKEDFSPNEDTAKLCCYVLRLAISQIIRSNEQH